MYEDSSDFKIRSGGRDRGADGDGRKHSRLGGLSRPFSQLFSGLQFDFETALPNADRKHRDRPHLPSPPASGYPGFYPVVTPPTPPAGVTTVLRLTPNSTGQSGSAWFTTKQPVAGPFSTTFTFQLSSPSPGASPGDGFAFVIQNSSSTALDPGNADGKFDGCSIGFGREPPCVKLRILLPASHRVLAVSSTPTEPQRY